jgi:hypothetical protein
MLHVYRHLKWSSRIRGPCEQVTQQVSMQPTTYLDREPYAEGVAAHNTMADTTCPGENRQLEMDSLGLHVLARGDDGNAEKDDNPLEPRESASTRALEIPELLELVLQHLSTKRLLMLQRVSRLWHRTIKNAPPQHPIRQKLFLVPEESRGTYVLEISTARSTRNQNIDRFCRVVPEDMSRKDTANWDPHRRSQCGHLNPLFFKRRNDEHLNLDHRMCSGESVLRRNICPGMSLPETARQMFISQPPCRELIYFVQSANGTASPRNLKRSSGVRVGDLLENLEKDFHRGGKVSPYEYFFMMGIICLSKDDLKLIRGTVASIQNGVETQEVQKTVDYSDMDEDTVIP